jgi:predicted MFS family arabinose efflux permease
VIARLLALDDVPRPLIPLLAVDALGSIAFSTFFVYIAIWGKERLNATDTQLGIAFVLAAAASALAATLGGALSDRIGRKPLVVLGWSVSGLAALVALAVGEHTLLGLAAYVLFSGMAAIGHGADTALVADLVPPEARERSFAAVRMTGNLGGVIGPAIGGGLLALAGWNALFVAATTLGVTATLIAARYLPSGGAYTPERRERGALRVLLVDGRFAAFWLVSVVQYVVYAMYETLLPISLTQSHGFSAASWGLLSGINPLFVVLFQLRVTRWSARSTGVAVRLAVATLLMGLPFLLLDVSAAVPVVVLLIVVFVIGEMLWVPTGQAVAERMSPAAMRGAYLGAFTATGAVGMGIGPLAGLQVRERAGDDAVWTFVAILSVAAALAALLIVRRLPQRGEARA